MRVLTVIGARPQFIKAAPVSRALRAAGIDDVTLHSGQHYDPDMSEVFFRELGLAEPDHRLDVGGLAPAAQVARATEGVAAAIQAVRPDWVLVYGDTNTTLAGALAAVKCGVPLAHVEAGARSFNRAMPEEINRILTDHAASLLLCASDASARLLAAEGITNGVHVTGDVMFDAVRLFAPLSERAEAPVPDRPYVVATLHRQENVDDPARLSGILDGLAAIARDAAVVLPLHPRTRGRIAEFGLAGRLSGLSVVAPLGYLAMLRLVRSARAVVTDSGGLQKEAFYLGVPCLTTRDETEWTETVELGWNRLVGTDAAAIAAGWQQASVPTGPVATPYGGGDAAERIARLLA